jgi:hypothetical protein
MARCRPARLALLLLLLAASPLGGPRGVAAYPTKTQPNRKDPLSKRRGAAARKYVSRLKPNHAWAPPAGEPPVDAKLAWWDQVGFKLLRILDNARGNASGSFQQTLPQVLDLTSEFSEVANRPEQLRVPFEERRAEQTDRARRMMREMQKWQDVNQCVPLLALRARRVTLKSSLGDAESSRWVTQPGGARRRPARRRHPHRRRRRRRRLAPLHRRLAHLHRRRLHVSIPWTIRCDAPSLPCRALPWEAKRVSRASVESVRLRTASMTISARVTCSAP